MLEKLQDFLAFGVLSRDEDSGLQFGNAYAAGAYDGEWTGSATSTGGRCKPASVTLTIEGKVVTGQARFDLEAPNINGTFREDGTFGATIGWQPLAGKLSQDEFEGTFEFRLCLENASQAHEVDVRHQAD